MSAGCCGHDAKFDGLDPRYKRILVGCDRDQRRRCSSSRWRRARWRDRRRCRPTRSTSSATRSTYGISLAVIGRSLAVRSGAALLKGASLMLMGLWVFGATAYQLLVLGVPRAEVMGVVGFSRWRRMSRACCCWRATRTATPMCARSGCARAMTRSAMSR